MLAVLLEAAWLVAVGIVYLTLLCEGYHGDAYLYWRSGIVGYPTVPVSGFVYPPPALLLFWPAHLLPYPIFYAGWLVLLMAAMRWLLGPWLMLIAIIPPFLGWQALASGNVALLIGAGIAYGVRHPAGWIIPALTKVTPAVGLLWFVVRREWRMLSYVLVAIGSVCALSYLIAPGLWPQWIHVSAMNAATTATQQSKAIILLTTVPPAMRLGIAALVVVLAAWRNAPWALPIAGLYAIGWIGDTSTLVALGSIRLLREGRPFSTTRTPETQSESGLGDEIVATYERRERVVDPDRYSVLRPGNRLAIEERKTVLLNALRNRGYLGLGDLDILEVGCGDGSELEMLVTLGADPTRLNGIDLRPDAVARARLRVPLANLIVGNASTLPFSSQTFDIVYQATALSSMRSREMRTQVAAEMRRVTRPGGIIVSYDFAWNPFNRDTVGIPEGELRRLFTGLPLEVHRITLAPPIGRWLGDRSVRLAALVARLGVLRTHRLGIVDIPA